MPKDIKSYVIKKILSFRFAEKLIWKWFGIIFKP